MKRCLLIIGVWAGIFHHQLRATIQEYVNETPFEVRLFLGFKKGDGVGQLPIAPGKSIKQDSSNRTLASVQGYWPDSKNNSKKLTSFKIKGDATFTFVGKTAETFDVVESASRKLLSSATTTEKKGVDLTLMTLNSYAFPVGLTKILRGATAISSKVGITSGTVDLASNIKIAIHHRIAAQAAFILQENPDVVVFQELWGSDNKDRMLNALGKNYPQVYYNETLYKRSKKGLNPADLDDGLLVVSKLPIIYQTSIIFTDKTSDEKRANKGALILGIHDRQGQPVILVNTHLQSGVGDEYIIIKEKQIDEIAQKIAALQKDPILKDAPIIIAGDLNEPIAYQEGVAGGIYHERRIIDRTKYLINILNKRGIAVTNDQVLQQLTTKYNPQYILEIFQLAGRKDSSAHTLYSPADPTRKSLPMNLPQNEHMGGGFPGHAGIHGSYWDMATDPTGWQILDHVFMTPNCTLLSYRVFRKEVLGDRGAKAPYNGDIALSDHAAVMVELGFKK